MPRRIIILWFCSCLLLLCKSTEAQCPYNIGFETGDFTNWQCASGLIDGSGNISLTPGAAIPGRQTIIPNSYPQILDMYGNFPINSPNGSSYSIKLGNESPAKKADQVSYTFTVPSGQDNYSIIYDYAVVFQNPNHQAYQQPKFTANIFDVASNTIIGCSSFTYVASAGLPGFQVSSVGASVFYKPWSSVTIKLLGYAGRTLRLEFTTNDCTLGGHFGYAYLDVNENCSSPISGNTYCPYAESITLTAPPGFSAYHWYDSSFTHLLGSANSLKLIPPPPAGTKYSVEIVPYAGFGCLDTLYTTIQTSNTPFVLNVLDSVVSCSSNGIDLTAPDITAGSTGGITFSYYLDSLLNNYLPTPKAVTKNGSYYIQGANAAGCSDIKPIYVSVETPPNLVINQPATVCYPNNMDLTIPSITSGSDPGLSISYWQNILATDTLLHANNITTSGTYYIKGAAANGCYSILPVTVSIKTLPPISVNNQTACDSVNLTAASVKNVSPSDFTSFNYFTDSLATIVLQAPNNVKQSGTYYIQAISYLGCSVVKPVVVVVHPDPVFTVTEPAAVTLPATVDITASIASNNNYQFSFWENSSATQAIDSPKVISTGGTYYIKAIDSFGCYDVLPVKVVIKEPVIHPSNAFSPNGDGINDTWTIPLLKFYPYCSVDIFNRYGQPLFHSLGYSIPWDGKFNGQPLPVGTYYYVIKLNETLPLISGSITILR